MPTIDSNCLEIFDNINYNLFSVIKINRFYDMQAEVPAREKGKIQVLIVIKEQCNSN